jgi:hypothetical protein
LIEVEMVGKVVEVVERSKKREARLVAVVARRDPAAEVVIASGCDRVVDRPRVSQAAVVKQAAATLAIAIASAVAACIAVANGVITNAGFTARLIVLAGRRRLLWLLQPILGKQRFRRQQRSAKSYDDCQVTLHRPCSALNQLQGRGIQNDGPTDAPTHLHRAHNLRTQRSIGRGNTTEPRGPAPHLWQWKLRRKAVKVDRIVSTTELVPNSSPN